MALPPRISIRGLRGKSFPTGYLVGRQSHGRGDLELMTASALRALGIASNSSVVQRTSAAGFGFNAEGLFLDNEFLGAGSFPFDVTFSDGDAGTAVHALDASSATAVMHIIAQDVSFLPVTVGFITFTAANKTGVVTWSGGQYILLAGRQISLYAPTPADVTLASVSGIVSGRK